MASKTKQTRKIRARKHRPNKVNQKAEQKRLTRNYEMLERLAESK